MPAPFALGRSRRWNAISSHGYTEGRSAAPSTILAKLAKAELAPLGFRRRGQSRLWLADNRSWLNVIEFTPSRWGKGASLINAAHWLWAGTGFLAFHDAISSNRHLDFETSEQFSAGAPDLIMEAASKAREVQQRFSSLSRTADFLIERARSSPDRMMPSWWGYEAGIAAGLRGDFATARSFLAGVTDARVTDHARHLLPLLPSPSAFLREINQLIREQRRTLRLPELEHPAFPTTD